MLSTFDVLSSIYKDWDKMNEAEQSSLALTLGMKTQIDVLSATLRNFDSALEAVNVSQNSSGSAMKENERYMESLGAKVNLLKAQFQELVLGEGGLAKFIKLLVDSGTSLLKFANSDIGQVIIKTTALLSVVELISKSHKTLSAETIIVSKAFKSLTNSYVANLAGVVALEVAQNGLKAGLVLLGTELKALTTTFLASPFGAGVAIVGGITLLTSLINNMTSSEEKHKEKLAETTEELQKYNSEIDKLEAKGDRTQAEETKLALLKLQTEELEKQRQKEAQITYELQSRNKERVIGSPYAGNVPNETITMGSQYGANPPKQQTTQENDVVNVIDKEIQKYRELIQEYNNLDTTKSSSIEKSEQLERAINDLTQSLMQEKLWLEESVDAGAKLSSEDEKRLNTLSDLLDKKEEEITSNEEQASSLSVLAEELETTEDALRAQARAMGMSEDAYAGYLRGLDSINEEMDSVSSLASELDDLTNAYQLTADAQYEYAQQGYLSVDTYSQLMQLQPQYLAMMFDENGQLYANADATNYLYQAKVLEMGISAARAQVNLAYSMMDEAGAYAALGQEARNAAGGVMELVRAQMQQKLSSIQANSIEDYNALVNNINAIDRLTKSTMANVGATTSSYRPTNRHTQALRKNTDARKRNSDATRAQTNALRAQKEALEKEAKALEKEIDDYEIVINYVKDLLREEQEALEEAKDKELKSIQKKIDALEEEQEAFEKNIEAQEKAIEKQRDEQEEYWDSQIDAIRNANDELDKNIRLQELQEALARAKTQKVKVFKGGQFIYDQDEASVSKAEKDLADYERELAVEKQIKELEKLKEEALNSLDKQAEKLNKYKEETTKNYEEQLQNLQAHYDKTEAEYDKHIKEYDNYMKQFEKMLNASARRHAEILYNELVGEKGNWDARMKALQNFVNNYDRKKSQLDGIKNQINNITDQIRGLESQSRMSLSNANNYANLANIAANNALAYASRARSSIQGWSTIGYYADGYGQARVNNISLNDAIAWYVKWAKQLDSKGNKVFSHVQYGKFANGTYSVPEDQIALVADPVNPSNRELVVGSKLNQGDGVLGKFKKGTGIIPHGQTLTENLVNLARWSQNGGLETISNTNNSTNSNVVNIGEINLPSVENGNDFVNYLIDNFMSDSIQFANIRK